MEQKPEPTIKGIFVLSHIQAVRKEKGEEGVLEIAKRFGRTIVFRNSDDVPVSDEIKIIEYALDVLTDDEVPANKRAFEAGRLHFRDFSSTPLGRMMLKFFHSPRLLLYSNSIAEHVFRGITFSTHDLGPNKIKIVMSGGHYPLDHFKGLFWEWIEYFGVEPHVEAVQSAPEVYEYTLEWKEKKK